MLRNPLYAGRIRADGFDVDARAAFEPIITDELFDRVQLVLDGKSGNANPRRNLHPDFPLRGFVKCAHCGRNLTGAKSTGRSKSYPYYHCFNCGAVRVKKEQLEAAFLAKLERMKMRPEFFAVLKTVVTDMWAQRRELARDAQQRSRTRIEVLQERMGQLEEAHIFRRSIDQATFERHQDQLREQIALAELELHESKLEELDIEGILAFAEQLLENPARLWSEASPAQRQRIQVALFPEGVPSPSTTSRRSRRYERVWRPRPD